MTVSKLIEVNTNTRDYEVVVGRSLLSQLQNYVDTKHYDKVFFVSDSNVWPLYGELAASSFRNVNAGHFVFKAGEESKNPSTLVDCLETMAEEHCSRDSLVVTLGGGVACDLGGFAAATFMRGIDVLQVPTSLLACVDASVGGKTAVDLRSGKNLFGAFHQPIGVICDCDSFETLSDEQFQDSVGEIVKHSILADKNLFSWLHSNRVDKNLISSDDMCDLVCKNVEIKRDIVVSDEFEGGRRQTLNLGHTIGHAIETASDFKLGHGSCVACGMAILVEKCAQRGITDKNVARQIIETIEKQGLPTKTDVSLKEILELIKRDKKRHGNAVNIVVVKDIADVVTTRMTFDEVESLLS